MKEIPARLQCSYCIRHRDHGGECLIPQNISQSGGGGCLGYKQDPLGCIRHKTTKLPFPLYFKIPLVGQWSDVWEINGLDTKVRMTRIRGVEWESNKGRLLIFCDIDYYINEYSPDYVEPTSKPKLTLIKGGN